MSRPVVVELFTSQGCSSCPPADALLGELAGRPDVLALSYHVTYWDRLGWPDTFGLEASTARQAMYAERLALRGLYTPQMVLDGRLDVVGSRGGRVRDGIALLAEHLEPGPPIAVSDGVATVGGGRAEPATLWLIAFDQAHDVAIERGENRGRILRYHHVVRRIDRLGAWRGQAIALPLPGTALAGRDGGALLLQRDADGAILAAARVMAGHS